MEYITRGWAEMSTTLTSLADGADLILTGRLTRGSPPMSLSTTTFRWPRCTTSRSGQRPPDSLVPSPLIRSAMTMAWWLYWRITKRRKTRNAVN